MPKAQQFIDVPINKGTVPDWDTRLGYPQITNMFCGESGFLYPTPGLLKLAEFPNARASHYSNFSGGVFIAVSGDTVFRITQNGIFSIVARIPFSGLPVQIDENLQNQVTITDGQHVYVYSQQSSSFTTLTSAQGMNFTTPCSVVVLNTFTIILDKLTGSWAVSDPNNALNYPPASFVPQIESQLTEAMTLETLDNNLYIFGSTGIERWVASLNTNQYIFPFSRDSSFRQDFGAISEQCVVRGINNIYFLSNRYVPMLLTEGSIVEIGDIGMSRIISQYADVGECAGSFYSFRGNYFYHLTFEETGIAWVFNQRSKTWALSDDLVLNSPAPQEAVVLPTGLYQLSLTPDHKKRSWIGERIFAYKGQETYRAVLNGFEVRMVQGLYQPKEPQYLELTLSLDSQSWLNTVRRQIGLTGERNAIITWPTNLTGYEFTPKVEYYGDLDFVINKATMYIT